MTRLRAKYCILLGLAGTGACSFFESGEEAIAHVRETAGAVEVKTTEAEAVPAAADMGLAEGNVITTGDDGRATLEFAGGNRISLQNNTSMVVQRAGAASAEIGAVLLSGSARASSTGEGLTLSIGTPFGMTELGATAADLEMSADGGIVVLVGQVSMVGEDGQAKTIEAGVGMSIDGLMINLKDEGGEISIEGLTAILEKKDQETQEDLVLEPITVILLANPKQVQIKRAGEKKWRTPKKRDVLKEGDSVRTRRANNTFVKLGESGGVTLRPNSEMKLATAGADEGHAQAAYALGSGSAVVSMRAKDGMKSAQALRAGGTDLKIVPGSKEANVEIAAGKGDRAQVRVRFGKVTLADGTVIRAGTKVNLEKGKVDGAVLPIAATDVTLSQRSASVIHYERDVPPVALTWRTKEPDKEKELEIAKDKSFKQILWKERVTGKRFVVDRLKPGRYYWRVNTESGWNKGLMTVTKAQATECKNCKRNNTVDDTGEQTTVYFQKALPSITLRWKSVAGASSYRAKVFEDGNFDSPLVNESITETTLKLGAGRLKEGRYYWLVSALDGGGKEVSTSPRMNSLAISYDNAVTDLQIKAPRNGARVSGGKLMTTGEVQLGASLAINGRSTSIDGKGRFRRSVSLAKGSNRIVYRTLAKDGVERFYLREVYRR